METLTYKNGDGHLLKEAYDHRIEWDWFETAKVRDPDPTRRETQEMIGANNYFALNFHLPDGDPREIRDLVVVMNGFGQLTDHGYNHPAEGLCARLPARGVAAVVLPLPFHLNRWPRGTRRFDKMRGPAFLVVKDMSRFYKGYSQVMADLTKLVEKIRAARQGVYSLFNSERLRIHLLGYSIGGLGVLTYQAKALATGIPPCETGILLASGCSFEALLPTEMGFPEKGWKLVREYYLNEDIERKDEQIGKEDFEYKVFRRIVLEKREPQVDELMDQIVGSTLQIVGAKDRVNPPTSMFGPAPGVARFITQIIPELGHVFAPEPEYPLQATKSSDEWIKWSDYVIDSFVHFLRFRPKFGNIADALALPTALAVPDALTK